jgi:hypothetical protein
MCRLPAKGGRNYKTNFLAMSCAKNIQTNCVKVTIFLSCLLTGVASQGQSPVDTLVKKFGLYRNEHLQEKLFVHLDRTTHLCGETIWFKVYSVNGTTHQLLNFSKVAYVEILSADNESVVQGKVPLANGTGEGSFFLPATLNTGNYILRAYTQWMKNYDPDFFFHQPVTIINPFRGNEPVPAKPGITYDAQFLPEGGNLVEGINSKVGFRVTNTAGKGIDFTGVVITARGDTVTRFAPSQSGIGSFTINPASAETYKAVIRDREGNVSMFPFPKVLAEGYTLRVERKTDEIQLRVRARLSAQVMPTVYLLIHTRNQLIETVTGTLRNGELNFSLPINRFGDGISHITLFDNYLDPVCERLIFKSPVKKLIITPQTNKSFYGNREAVSMTLDVRNETSLQEGAELSVAVYKLDSLSSFPQHTISSYLLLSSDLHGRVESPEAYFQSNNQEANEEALDQLMLTHGWRRFRWDNLLKGSPGPPAFLPEIQGLTLNGKLLTESGKAAPGIQAFASFPSRNNLFFTTLTRRNGDFHFILKNVYGNRKIILQTNFAKDSLNVFAFKTENPFVKRYATIPLPVLTLDPSVEHTLIDKSTSLQVQDIFKKESSPVTMFPYDSSAFYGKADETYYLDDYTRFTVMEEVLREYVPGVLVRKRKGQFYLSVRDIVNHATLKEEEPLMLLDGVPFFDTDKLMTFDPLKVKKLEVMTKIFLQGQSGFAGIASFSTYTGDLAGFELHPGSVVQDFEGLQLYREFYQPRYENDEARRSREPDQRSLLLWAPRVTVTNGRAELHFYTSDQSGYFQAEVQGLGTSGRMGSGTCSFRVDQPDK